MTTLGDYEYGSKLLGSGAFALVYEGCVKNRPNERVAIKIPKQDTSMPKSKTLLGKEISVLKDLNHENIVRLYHHGVSNSGLYLVMELCNGGDLSGYLGIKGTLPEDTIRHFLAQIGSAMYAINRKGFMHRDLKPGNILLTFPSDCGFTIKDIPGHLITFKLADFGFARWLQDGMMAVTMCGSPMYMAPEVLMCKEYDARADIWSMGVILYQCLTGKAPFYANNPEQLKNIYTRTPNLRPQIPPTTSEPLRRLLLRMLVREPKDRIDFAHFLEHPFLHPERRGSSTFFKPASKGAVFAAAPSRVQKDQPTFSTGINVTAVPGGQKGKREPFYLDPRRTLPQRDRTPQSVPVASPKGPDTAMSPTLDLRPLRKIPPYRDPQFVAPLDPTLDGLDDEMSRTTVDDYIEDELDTSSLPLEPTPYPHANPEPFRPLGLPIQGAPPVPSRGSSVPRFTNFNRNVPVPKAGQGYNSPFSLRPFLEPEPDEAHLDGFIIVNANGTAMEPHPRNFRPSGEPTNAPMSNIGRIVTNPTAYLTNHQRAPAAQSPALPDVAATSPVNQRTEALEKHRNNPPLWLATQQDPVKPVEAPPENAGQYQVAAEPVRLRPHSGGGIIDYGHEAPNGIVNAGWQVPELSEEHIDTKHNEEIKTITMVLELCELLSELAQRRASVLADCTVTSTSDSSSPPVQEDSGDDKANTPLRQPDGLASDESSAADTHEPAGLKFVSEDQRIVEQIVLYRRVLYYLEYVFVQVKKAFHHGQLRSTPVSRARLNDCYRLYQVCYMRLKELTRQSRRDDLIEPVGRLLAKITANRLIFQYALLQCRAAEMDVYVGELAQAFQRYKAAITLIHGLRQHAKTENDKTVLADRMRLLQERYYSLRVMATKHQPIPGYFGRNPGFPTLTTGSSPVSDGSNNRMPTAPFNPLNPGLNDMSPC